MLSLVLFVLVSLVISQFNKSIEVSEKIDIQIPVKKQIKVTARLAVYDQILNYQEPKSEWWHGLSCSLEVRNSKPNSNCCLLLSKSKKPLYGGAYEAKYNKLKRKGILL